MIKDTIKSIIAIIPPQFRQRPLYYKTKKWLRRSLDWSPEQLEKMQVMQLRRIVYLAYNNTSGYRQLYKEAGVQPSDIQKLTDLKNLPMVNKDLLRDNIKDFTVIGSGQRYNSTGGTTGKPFGFYLNRRIFAKEAAFMHNEWSQWGWKLGQASVVLRGSFIGSQQKIVKYSSYTKELFFSASHLSIDNFPIFLKAYQHAKSPTFIQAYPSALSLLCDLIEQYGQNPFSFQTLFLGSENIYQWQIEKFKRYFPKASIHSWYGHAEKACFANLIPNSSLQYEVHPLYGLAEPGPTNDNGMNEIIATGFINTATPFIRYQTSDYALFGQKSNSELKYTNSTHFEKIDGRLQEVVITKSKKFISMTSMSIHEGLFENLSQFQFEQSTPGQLNLKVVPRSNFSEQDRVTLQEKLNDKFNHDIDFSIDLVDKIEKTHRGKMRYLIQNLDIKYSLNEAKKI